MLRAETDKLPMTPDTVENHTVDVRDGETATGDHAQSALAHARSCLEAVLDQNEAWRALRQLDAREESGEWLDVMESDDLRGRLTHELVAQPAFLAWQFVDAAMACLKAGTRVLPSSDDSQIPYDDEYNDITPKSSVHVAPRNDASVPVTPESEIVLSSHVPPGPPPLPPAGSAATTPPPVTQAPTFTPAKEPAIVTAVASVANTTVPIPPLRALALRIPTLQPHDLKSTDLAPHSQKSDPPKSQNLPLPAQSIGAAQVVQNAAPARHAHADITAEDTLFDATAIGIGEADVQIVRRGSSANSIVNTRLPPLPLSDRPTSAPPRQSRAPVAKWADNDDGEPDDYRPIGSALDEAQVTIISKHDQDEARARAERRALGVAPDREAQMRRFLKALSGE